MLTKDEIIALGNKTQVSPMVIFREYAQLIFLQKLSESKYNHQFIFKGGTAIRLLMKGSRFSEDLDFTIKDLNPDQVTEIITSIISTIKPELTIQLKPLKSVAGLSLKLMIESPIQTQLIPIKLDFSFREMIFDPTKSIVICNYPIIFKDYIHHYSQDEIVAEKIRAILHRSEGRDLYDLWFLLTMQAELNLELIQKKLAFYDETLSKPQLLDRIADFPKKNFMADLAAFVTKKDRDNLDKLYDVIQSYLKHKLTVW